MSGAVKDVLALRRAGKTYREIAALTGLAISTVVDRIERARAAEQDKRYMPRAKTERKERVCLCCGARFMSWGAGNRLCSRCRAKDDYMLFAA